MSREKQRQESGAQRVAPPKVRGSIRSSAATLVALIVVVASVGCSSMDPYLESSEEIEVGKRGKSRTAATLSLSRDPSADAATQESEASLTSPLMPGSEIYGIYQIDSNRFYVHSVRLFGNWANGWTEGLYEATGGVAFEGDGPTREATLTSAIELWSIRKGEIRYFDDYILGEEGISAVDARVARLAALADWYGGSLDDSASQALAAVTEARPDRFAPLVDSGTLARDVEEAPGIFLFYHRLSYLEESILSETRFKEIE